MPTNHGSTHQYIPEMTFCVLSGWEYMRVLRYAAKVADEEASTPVT